MSVLNKRLKMLRIEKGLTQEQVAKDLGTTKVSIGRYENGTREPKSEMLEAISNYYNVSIDYLFGKTDLKNNLLNKDNDTFLDLAQQFDTRDDVKKLMLRIYSLEEDDRIAIEKMIENAYLKKISKEEN